MPIPASGEQIELAHDGARAVVVEVGGGLREYTVDGRSVLDGYGLDEPCPSARGQILIPWPNRLRDGRYDWGGGSLQVPLTEPARHNAIHGFVRWTRWRVRERDASRVTMEQVLHPRDGYPFMLELEVAYALQDGGLTVTTTATNVGRAPAPYGAGAHPYLKVDGIRLDDCTLQAPGATWMPTDDRAIPTGSEAVAGGEYDFRTPRPLGATRLDTGFGDLDRGDDGRARVTLAGDGRSVTLWHDEAHPYLMLFTGDSLPDERRRRRGLGVEPMTCAPNAFQTGEGLRRLEPGERAVSSWGISAEG